MAKPYKVIDLFAGAGGLALGFKQAGFVPILAIESEEDFADTYRENIGDHVLIGDIVEFVEAGIDTKADVVVGGPPCQGFSNLTGNRHGCHRGRSTPSTRVRFWNEKLEANRQRDAKHRRRLRRLGWGVLAVWECQTSPKKLDRLMGRITTFLGA